MLPSGQYASYWNDFLYKDVFYENEALVSHPVELPVKKVSIFNFSSFSTHLNDLATFGLNLIRSNCLLGDKNSIMCLESMKSWAFFDFVFNIRLIRLGLSFQKQKFLYCI